MVVCIGAALDAKMVQPGFIGPRRACDCSGTACPHTAVPKYRDGHCGSQDCSTHLGAHPVRLTKPLVAIGSTGSTGEAQEIQAMVDSEMLWFMAPHAPPATGEGSGDDPLEGDATSK